MRRSRSAFLLSLWLAGCTTYSTFQTGRTLPRGSQVYTAGLGHMDTSRLPDRADYSISPQFHSWWLEAGMRWGVEKSIDIGAKVAVPLPYSLANDFRSGFVALGPVNLDIKAQLLDGRALALAAGAGASYANIRATDVSVHVLEGFFPLILSLDLSRKFSLYTSARVVLALARGSAHTSAVSLGGTLGFRYGAASGVFFEVSRITPLIAPFDKGILTWGVSVYFGVPAKTSGTSSHAQRWQRDPREKIPPRLRSAPFPANQSHVVSVNPSEGEAILSHSAGRLWKVGERVCLSKGPLLVVCGTIVGSDSAGGMLKWDNQEARVEKGMPAIEESRLEEGQKGDP